MTKLAPEPIPEVVLGVISGVFGVKGWLKVRSETRPRLGINAYGRWWLQHPRLGGQWFVVQRCQAQGAGVIARLEGIDDREVAEHWVGAEIRVSRVDLPPLAEGDYYWRDLLGLRAIGRDGEPLGEVVDLIDLPVHDVLVLRDLGPQGPVERLVPFVRGIYVQSVDLRSAVIRLDWSVEFDGDGG